MSDILSQEEIEALLSSLSETTESDSPEAGSVAERRATSDSASATSTLAPPARKSGFGTTIAYEVYDFRRPDKFSKEQLRTLQMLHETFARMAGTSLSSLLRTNVNIELIALEQIPYEEYLRSINQSVFTIMSLPPLNGQAVMEIEFALIFQMIDRLLGGPGKVLNRNNLTEIEEPLVRQIIDRMFISLKSAWEGVVMVTPGIEAMETSAQSVQIAPPTDIVVSILFEVRIGDTRAATSLCIPYMLLKPITTKLSAQKWFATGQRKKSTSNRRLLTAHLEKAVVEGSVLLGKKKIRVRDFLALKVGDTVVLNQNKEHDLKLVLGGSAKFLGKPAQHRKKVVFNIISEVPRS